MEVVDRLPGQRVAVEHGAEALFGDSPFPRQAVGDLEEAEEKGLILRGEIEERGDVLSGNDENVNRRLRVDVLESHHFVVFEDDAGRKLLVAYPAEEAVTHAPILQAGARLAQPSATSMGQPSPLAALRSFWAKRGVLPLVQGTASTCSRAALGKPVA